MLLVFIIAIGCAYYYRSLIFSEIINTYVDNTVNRVLVWANIVPEEAAPAIQEAQKTQEAQEAQVIQVVQDCGSQEEVVQTPETGVVKCECEVAITKFALIGSADVDQEVDDEPVQLETEESVPGTDTELTTDTEPQQIVAEEPEEIEEQVLESQLDQAVDEEPTQAETDEPTIETEPDQAIFEETELTDEDTNNEVALENNAATPHSELINQARLLHLTGNTSNAIDLYRELAQLYPDDPNVYGELGNVFYLKGDWEQASQAYYEAALRLQKLRMTEQIHYLYLVIHGLNPDIAEKLREQLDS